MTKTNDNDLTYEQWFATADRLCVEGYGLSINDLPDGPSWDAWEDGEDPASYLAELLANEGVIEE